MDEKEIRAKSIEHMKKFQELLDQSEFAMEKAINLYPDKEAMLYIRTSLRFMQLAMNMAEAAGDTASYMMRCMLAGVEPSKKPITLEDIS